MSGIGWKASLRRPAAPDRHGNPQLRRVAARYLSPGPQKPTEKPVQREVAPKVSEDVGTSSRASSATDGDGTRQNRGPVR
jgi:hypothetical protein